MVGTDICEKVWALHFPRGSYVVVGGGCLAVRGLRETEDIDILVTDELFEELQKQGWSLDKGFEKKHADGQRRLKKDNIEIHHVPLMNDLSTDKIIAEADIIENIPFQNLDNLKVVKQRKGRDKDLQDIILIENYLARQK